MERIIYFGCVRSYQDANGSTVYCAEYMTDDGFVHRDRISVNDFNTIRSRNVVPGTMITGTFNVDAFNSLHLIDLIV